jgi:hypothetical protein
MIALKDIEELINVLQQFDRVAKSKI